MRASSSWIKLQFVVRKHVMNTYQMHTLTLLFFFFVPYPVTFSHPPLFASLCCLNLRFFCVLVSSDSQPASSAHFLTGFLMVRHTDVTHPELLHNVLLCMYMCIHMVVHILKLPSLHMHLRILWVSSVIFTTLHHNSATAVWKLVRYFVWVVLLCYCQWWNSTDLITGLWVDVLICRL